MVKYILAGVVFFLAVAVAFYGGLFIGRTKPDPPLGLPRPPAEDHWTYPGSALVARTGLNQSVFTILATPDDFDSVARFYSDRIGATTGLGDNFDPQRNETVTRGFAWGTYTRASDSRQMTDGVSPRKVRVWAFEVRSQVYDLNVVVNRAEGEAHTHVIITYDPKPPP